MSFFQLTRHVVSRGTCRTFVPVLLIPIMLLASTAAAQPRPGAIGGRVLESTTGLALPGASIGVEPGTRGRAAGEGPAGYTSRGDAAGDDGAFLIDGLKAGRYVVTVRFLGFQAVVRPDVEVAPGRTTVLEIALSPEVYEAEEVVVRAGWFARQVSEPAGVSAFGTEEIRRAAGAAADVQRLLAGLPSVARMDDMKNGLAVRGGSPFETRFVVDGFPVPNLDHFPTQGASGGALGIIAADLIGEVTFRPGAFPAGYADRLGAVVDLDLRPSSDRALALRGDFSIAGAGLFAEGSSGPMQWLVAGRRSWVDLLVKSFMAEQADAIPTYSDLVVRATWRPASSHRLTFLNLAAIDRSGIERDKAREAHENLFGTADFDANTVGLKWQATWGTATLSTTTLSHSYGGRTIDFSSTADAAPALDDRSREHTARIGHETRFVRRSGLTIDAGFDMEVEAARYRTVLAGGLADAPGATTLSPSVDRTRAGAFLAVSWPVGGGLSLDPGFRIDRYGQGVFVQPRVAARVAIFPSGWVRIAGGRYVQSLPSALVAQDEAYGDLRPPKADHITTGLTWHPREAMQVTFDVYAKQYRHLPENPAEPHTFALDRLYDDALPLPLWPGMGSLNTNGRARSRGVELMVQQRLARKVYGLASLAFHRSEYRDATGMWRPRLFDNGLIATIDGGWRPDERNQVGFRFTWAGGRPYTPFDEVASAAAGTGIPDVNHVQGERLPAYHGLTLRYDRRFPIAGAWVVSYAEVWNVYGRRNLSGLYWDEVDGRVRDRLQWGTLPVIGFEILFR